MVNYYDELKIDKILTIDEIIRKLNQMESTWMRREITNPEKARKMLILIGDARKIFATEKSREDYDKALEEKNSHSSDNDASFEVIQTILNKVKAFSGNNQWDLAKIALDKELTQINKERLPDEQMSELYRFAGQIYSKNGLYQQAIDFENQSIVLAPDIIDPYIEKASILSQLIGETTQKGQDAAKDIANLRVTCQTWIDLAKTQEKKELLAFGLESLAKCCLLTHDYPSAYRYVTQAKEIAPQRNDGNSIISFLEQRRTTNLYELNSQYNYEEPLYKEKILDTIKKIVSLRVIPENGVSIVVKRRHWEEEKGYYVKEEDILFDYRLTQDGAFELVTSIEYSGYNKSKYTNTLSTSTRSSSTNCSLDYVMRETDFDVYCETRRQDSDGCTFMWTGSANEAGGQYERIEITRKNSIKGKALFLILDGLPERIREQLERERLETVRREEQERLVAEKKKREEEKRKQEAKKREEQQEKERERIRALNRIKEEEAKKADIYSRAEWIARSSDNGALVERHEKAIKLLGEIRGWRDVDEKIVEYQRIVDEQRNWERKVNTVLIVWLSIMILGLVSCIAR